MLSNFSNNIKKYNPNEPAWFNTTALKLHAQAQQEGKHISFLQHYLYQSKGNLEELKLKLGLTLTFHPELPLVIFNYSHVNTPHDSLIGLECRGLVLEKDTWNIVAKPMNRFFNWGEIDLEGAPHPNLERKQFDFNNFMTQSKEDGSLMVMFYYQGHWMLNTRTFFLNNLPNSKVIMSGIHEVYTNKVIDVFTNALGEDIKQLDDLDKYLDRNNTYCFELCTEFNKIVRNYEKDSVFLLSIINSQNFKEFAPEEIDKVAQDIGAMRPKDYQLKSFDAILQAMKEVISKDPSLEGFVIRDVHGSRWKIKSPSYFFLHHISYDKMRTPYPKDLVPLILQGEGTELFTILEINGFQAELFEVQKQWTFCENRLKHGWEQLKKDWENLINLQDTDDFIKGIREAKTPFTGFIEELYKAKKTELTDLENKWYESADTLIENLFTKEEQRPANIRKTEVKVEHITGYQKAQDRKKPSFAHIFKDSEWWKKIKEDNDGLAKQRPDFKDGKWLVHCACGKEMQLYSVPEYWYDYKCAKAPDCNYCKDSIVDKKKQTGALQGKGSNPVLTYQCECGLSHRAHQHQKKIDNELKRRPLKGKPLGIPCSEICLIMRHLAHEEIEIIMKEFQWNRDQTYKEASKLLDVNMEDSHVGMLGISQCRELIIQFRDMRGADI